jgi:hypothetical protein
MDPKRTARDPAAALQALDELLAEGDAEYALTDDDRRWAREQNAAMHVQIAAMRRRLTPPNVTIQPADPVPPEIALLSRAELLAQLETLGRAADARIASLDVNRATDDDLRHLLALLINADAE